MTDQPKITDGKYANHFNVCIVDHCICDLLIYICLKTANLDSMNVHQAWTNDIQEGAGSRYNKRKKKPRSNSTSSEDADRRSVSVATPSLHDSCRYVSSQVPSTIAASRDCTDTIATSGPINTSPEVVPSRSDISTYSHANKVCRAI